MIGFELHLAEIRARDERRRAIVRASIDMKRGGKVDLPLNGRKEHYAIISPNIDPDPKEREQYPWRVTTFDERGPWGHTVHKRLDGKPGYCYDTSAVQEVALNIKLDEE